MKRINDVALFVESIVYHIGGVSCTDTGDRSSVGCFHLVIYTL